MAHNMANLSQQSSPSSASALTCQQQQQQQQQSQQMSAQTMVYVSKNIKKSFDDMFKVVQNDQNPNLKSWRQRNMPKSFFEPPTSSSASSAAHSRDSSVDSSCKVNSKPPTPTTTSTMLANSPPSNNNNNNNNHQGPALFAMSCSSPHRTTHCTPPPGLPQVVHQKAFSCPETTRTDFSGQNHGTLINVNGHKQAGGISGGGGQMIGQNLIQQQQQQQQQSLQQQQQQQVDKNHNRQQSYDINKIPLPDDWEMDFEPRTGDRYYLNHKLKITQWDDPRMVKMTHNNNNNNNHHHSNHQNHPQQLSFMTQTLSHSNPSIIHNPLNIHQQQQRIIQQQPTMVMFSSQPNIHTTPGAIINHNNNNNSQQSPQMDQSPCNLRQRQQVDFQLNNQQQQQQQQLPTAGGNNNLTSSTPNSTVIPNGEYICQIQAMIDPNGNGNIPVELVSAMENMNPLGSPKNPMMHELNLHDYQMEIKNMRERQKSLLKMPGMKRDYKPPLQQTSDDPFLTNSREMINNIINDNTIINSSSDQINHVRQTSQDSGLGSTSGYPNTLESCPFNNGADFINDFGLQRQNNLSNGIGGLPTFDGGAENMADLESIEIDDLMINPNFTDLLQISHDESMTWHV